MKTFKIKLDKVRVLKFTNRTIKEMEDHFGGSPFIAIGLKTGEESEIMLRMSSISVLHKIVYFALRHDAECPTMDECLDIIPMNRAIEIATECFEILSDCYGLTDEVPESELKQNGQAVGIGKKLKA